MKEEEPQMGFTPERVFDSSQQRKEGATRGCKVETERETVRQTEEVEEAGKKGEGLALPGEGGERKG